LEINMPFLTSLLRSSLLREADPIQAGLQIDFEEREGDPSKYTLGQNLHPAMDEMDGEDGMGAPYDGAQIPGGGMGMGMGGDPSMPPADAEMQPIEPGMQQGMPSGMPGEEQQPPMQEGYMKDQLDLFLDQLLDENIEEISEAPFDNNPRDYAGFSGPQRAPASVAAGGPDAIRQWQSQMADVGRGGGRTGSNMNTADLNRQSYAANGGYMPTGRAGGGRPGGGDGGGRPGGGGRPSGRPGPAAGPAARPAPARPGAGGRPLPPSAGGEGEYGVGQAGSAAGEYGVGQGGVGATGAAAGGKGSRPGVSDFSGLGAAATALGGLSYRGDPLRGGGPLSQFGQRGQALLNPNAGGGRAASILGGNAGGTPAKPGFDLMRPQSPQGGYNIGGRNFPPNATLGDAQRVMGGNPGQAGAGRAEQLARGNATPGSRAGATGVGRAADILKPAAGSEGGIGRTLGNAARGVGNLVSRGASAAGDAIGSAGQAIGRGASAVGNAVGGVGGLARGAVGTAGRLALGPIGAAAMTMAPSTVANAEMPKNSPQGAYWNQQIAAQQGAKNNVRGAPAGPQPQPPRPTVTSGGSQPAGNLVAGGALKQPAPQPAAATPTPAAPAAGTPNLVPGGAMKTAAAESKEWKMTWNDFVFLSESDKSGR
jgi:hypothetical protein